MKLKLTSLLICFVSITFAQVKDTTIAPLRWEISVGSGLYLDFFPIIVDFKPSYSTKEGKYVNTGKTDRIELKYLFNNKKSAISLYYQNAQYKQLIGSSLDPLEAWTDFKRVNRRMHFTINYYRMFQSGKNGTWSIGSGFQVQIEKTSFPFYRVDNVTNPTAITYISAKPYWSYFEDWAIPLTIAHDWTINKNLKLGIKLNTAYTTFTGVDGLSLLGNIAIPFGKKLKERKEE
jgi:hypothetical protein